MVTFETVRRMALALPEAEEGMSYGTPAFKVRQKLFARLREEGVLMVKCDLVYKDILLQSQPAIYFTTPHYDGYAGILVRLDVADEEELRDLLADAWRMAAPKRLVAAHEGTTI
jgi:hypothetical protein